LGVGEGVAVAVVVDVAAAVLGTERVVEGVVRVEEVVAVAMEVDVAAAASARVQQLLATLLELESQLEH
jgi:hypothetical protein